MLSINSSNQGNTTREGKSVQNSRITEWTLSDLIEKSSVSVQIKGEPLVTKFKENDAISFNGLSDAIFLESMPLTGLEQFTIEIIFRPVGGGKFEQRFLHFGEVQGDRVLLELRSTGTDWYFDAFIKDGDNQLTLIEPGLIHPLDKWYHLACVIDHGKMVTFVNRKKELEGKINVTTLNGGKTSIGVRQNEVSWFKGEIYKIRITPEALKPAGFMKY